MRIAVAFVVAACLVLAPTATSVVPAAGIGDAAKLRKAVNVQGMKKHEQAFQNIASANGNTRSSGTPGYQASVEYVVGQLVAAGYTPDVQEFDFPFFSETAPAVFQRTSAPTRNYVLTDEFVTMTYSGSGNVNAALQEVNDNQFPPGPTPSSSNAGCELGDFAGFVPGRVALIQRGTCTFHDKALNAQTVGASAVVIFNEGQPGRTDTLAGTLGTPDFHIPIIGISFASGQELHNLMSSGPVTVHIQTSTESEIRQTWNVLAETPWGDPNQVIVQGSHLDSVVPGPGINDNGSGSAYNLESAIQVMKNRIKTTNKIRFAWWGAEEFNLLGSTFYVESLSDEDFAKIKANLNFDMIASPNFVRFVYDGDGSDTGTEGPPGSGEIEQMFVDWFDSQGLASEPTAFDGRSDYGPFIDRGAPAGGLFTGAEGVKTVGQALVYGGVAGEAYDRCYHQACDTISNLNDTGFDQMSDAAATVLMGLAAQKAPSNGKPPKPPKPPKVKDKGAFNVA
jgi:Zn-dependent M28 family amino/carboxypeptidase